VVSLTLNNETPPKLDFKSQVLLFETHDMSTLFKTAAMGLLSKTLQTLLNKYLLEVDVEGVAMPSLIDVDGHSGWGVRLCNVRLREGVELATLPGKRRVKKTRNRQDNNGLSRKSRKNRLNDPTLKRKSSKSTNCNQKDGQTRNEADETMSKTENDEELTRVMKESQDRENSRSRILSEDTDLDSALSSRVPSPSFVCKSSVLSAVTGCLSKPSNNQDQKSGGEKPLIGTDSVLNVNGNSPFVKQAGFAETASFHDKSPIKPKELFAAIDNINSKLNPILTESIYNDNYDLEMDEESSADEEEYFTEEEDMVLYLGKAGRIGTLDVRLIGKELHIMIEDASLTLEARPKPQNVDQPAASVTSNSASSKDDRSNSKKKETKKAAKQTSKKDLVTPGDRILDRSILAKTIFGIPHLLLRDVRIQFIICNTSQTSKRDALHEVDLDDSIIEVNLEMLSVASGEDLLEKFGSDGESKPPNSAAESNSSRHRVSLQSLEELDENEYLTRRIRTGKGPEGGITVKVFPPLRKSLLSPKFNGESNWAKYHFEQRSQYCLLRFSGLDIRARIFLGKQKEVAIRNNDYAWYGEEYDEYTFDSMLYGMDYIASTPAPLQPLNHTTSLSSVSESKAEVEKFNVDGNGIQSNRVRSCFHKVARGLMSTICSKDHLPSEHCIYCWVDPARPNSYSEHPFDSRTPLPGIILNVEISEPIELNIDRSSLETIGTLHRIFVTEEANATSLDEKDIVEEVVPVTTSLTQKLKSIAFRKKIKKESLKAAFPSYMQPETIEIVGLYLCKVILRMHVMKKSNIYDEGFAFRYWEARINCITADVQMHNSKEKIFHDVRFDLGYIVAKDYFGVEEKDLISLGSPILNEHESDKVNNHTWERKELEELPYWPNTASVMLQVPSIAKEYKLRAKHALQLRLHSIGAPDIDVLKATLDVRLGVLTVEMPNSFITDVDDMILQILSCLRGRNFGTDKIEQASAEINQKSNRGQKKMKIPAWMKYFVSLEGGNVNWHPYLHCKIPRLDIKGDASSENEFLVESILNQVAVKFGQSSKFTKEKAGLSLSSMANLPESVRMRILFFLKDLGPLEKALGIPREKSPFLRCRAVNKGIVKAAKRSSTKPSKRKKGSRLNSESKLRREDIIAEIWKLDDRALGELWTNFRSRRPRASRIRASSDSKE
jgi:hypothetical protein